MKICDLTQFYSPVSGGVKRYVSEKQAFIEHHTLDDEHVLIVPGETTGSTREGRCAIYTIASPLVNRTSRYRALLNLRAVEEVLENERPDIIESGDPYQMAWKAQASGRALRIPVVGFYHSHFPEAYLRSATKFLGGLATEIAMDAAERYVRTLYSRFERTLVPSQALAELLRDWRVENVSAIDLGVNTSVFKPDPDDAEATRARLGLPADRTLLLYVGRLAIEKNTATLFRAYEQLVRDSPGRFHLLAVGDGAQRPVLETKRDSLGNDAVSWTSYCSDSGELAQLYRTADLFVHPGILETFGLVTLEAQACGTPVVGIRGSYMDRIVFSGQTHWARENTDAALAEAIAAMADQDLRMLGRGAASEVAARFSWQGVFARLFAIYREVCANYRP